MAEPKSLDRRPLVIATSAQAATARVRVRLAALARNYQALRDRVRGDCAAVVKANAYGLGVEAAAEVFSRCGCSVFCVASLDEGIELRALQPAARIIVLGGSNGQSDIAELLRHKLEPVLNSPDQAAAWHPHRDQAATLHVDTGMERLGFTEAQLLDFDWADFRLATIMTHLACADEPDNVVNAVQLTRFRRALALLPPRAISIANSAGCLLGDEFHGDLVRPGIGLYGGHPRNQVADNPMAPVVSVEGRVVALRKVGAHTPVGYGGSYIAPVDMTLAVVGIGYADGLPRLLSSVGEAVIAGKRVPIVGRLSMDLVHLDISALMTLPAPPKVGDWAQFVGADIGVDEVAQWVGTIGLEILCGLGRRPTWEYVSD